MNTQSAFCGGEVRRPDLYANYGSPMGRHRTEQVVSSLLGKDSGWVRCPRVIRAGLRFRPGEDPVAVLWGLLSHEGCHSPEQLRAEFDLPGEQLICRPLTGDEGRVTVEGAARRDVLRQALLLGLCTNQVYDPARPVLWTGASLTRSVELFEPGGFYS